MKLGGSNRYTKESNNYKERRRFYEKKKRFSEENGEGQGKAPVGTEEKKTVDVPE